MNTFDAAGVILIVFAGFELMRWFDTIANNIRSRHHNLAKLAINGVTSIQTLKLVPPKTS